MSRNDQAPTLKVRDKESASGTTGRPTMVLSSAGNGHIRRSRYKINNYRKVSNHWRALIDRGANGSIAGRDMKVIRQTGQSIDLSGIDDHTIRNLPIVDAGGVTRTPTG